MKSSASIVLYHNNIAQLKRLLSTLLSSEIIDTIYLIDNSETNVLWSIESLSEKIVYIFNNKNIGFGKAHNIAVKKARKKGYTYHFVINPDVYLDSVVLGKIIAFMSSDDSIGMVMPQILNNDNTVQFLPKLLPSPASLVMRKLKWPKKLYHQFVNKYELRYINEKKIYNSPLLSGCFSLVNTIIFEEAGGYDDRFFMYFEDWDLSRRINMNYQTIYFPMVSIVHDYESGANKSFKLAKIFIVSAFKYFNKWGWFIDKDRQKVNKKTLDQFTT